MSYFRGARHLQDRVPSAKGIWHCFLGQWVGYPSAIHSQAVFIGAECQCCFIPPMTNGRGVQSLGLRSPIVECSGHAYRCCFWIIELKANRHELWTGAAAIGMAAAVIMVLIVFHGCGVEWFPCRPSFAEHFGHNEYEGGPAQSSAEEQVDQGVSGRAQHRQ